MKAEKTIMITGKKYQEIKAHLESNQSYSLNYGTEGNPQIIKVTDIYLDTDPEFTRNPKQYAKVHDDKSVQVVVEFDEA